MTAPETYSALPLKNAAIINVKIYVRFNLVQAARNALPTRTGRGRVSIVRRMHIVRRDKNAVRMTVFRARTEPRTVLVLRGKLQTAAAGVKAKTRVRALPVLRAKNVKREAVRPFPVIARLIRIAARGTVATAMPARRFRDIARRMQTAVQANSVPAMSAQAFPAIALRPQTVVRDMNAKTVRAQESRAIALRQRIAAAQKNACPTAALPFPARLARKPKITRAQPNQDAAFQVLNVRQDLNAKTIPALE